MSREEIKNALRIIKQECNRNTNDCESCTVFRLLGAHCKSEYPDRWFVNKNEKIYSKVIERLELSHINVDDEKEVIAALAEEIEIYRKKIKALSECKQQNKEE